MSSLGSVARLPIVTKPEDLGLFEPLIAAGQKNPASHRKASSVLELGMILGSRLFIRQSIFAWRVLLSFTMTSSLRMFDEDPIVPRAPSLFVIPCSHLTEPDTLVGHYSPPIFSLIPLLSTGGPVSPEPSGILRDREEYRGCPQSSSTTGRIEHEP